MKDCAYLTGAILYSGSEAPTGTDNIKGAEQTPGIASRASSPTLPIQSRS